MDSHIGMRQSTRVAIKKSLADMAGKEDDLEKVAKPVGKADMVKNKRRATEKKFFGNRKRRNVKRAGKKRALVRAKAADMPEVEFLSLGSDDLLMTEEVSREDCTTMVATDFEEPLEQPAEVSMRAILDGLLETLGEDLAQFKVEMEEEKDGDSQTFEEIQEVPSPTEDTADERDDSIEAQLLHLVTPFPQKLNPLIDYPPAEPPAKLSPVRGEKKLKICSWLIEGMLSESVIDYIRNNDWDILCLQGLRWSDKNQVPSEFERILQPYHCYWRFEEQGFCLLVMSRIKAENEIFNENFEKHLVQTLGFDGFVLANALAPSAGTGLVDLDDKLKWFDTLSGHLDVMNETPVIIAGSLGVAHRAIDIADQKTIEGFTKEEQGVMTALLENGYTDSFRFLNEDQKVFSSFTTHPVFGRLEGTGIRSHYFIVSDGIKECIKDSVIRTDIDDLPHCPIELSIDLENAK